MQVELKDLSAVKKQLTVKVPAEMVEQARQRALTKIQKEVEIKGFRKGKVPFDLIEKQFGSEVQKETMEMVVQGTYPLAIDQKKLKPITQPQIQPKPLLAGTAFTYEATLEVFPEIEIKNYQGLKVDQEEVGVEKEEVQEELKRLQISMTQVEAASVEAGLEEGFIATIDFEGAADGKPFEGSSAKALAVDWGSGHLLEDFEKKLKGIQKGEKRTVAFSYPKDYFNKELAGKKAEFHVVATELRKKNVPELNDEFAKDLGNYESLKQVEEEIQSKMHQHKKRESDHQLTRVLLEQLIQSNKFDVPEAMISEELRGMLENLARELKQRNQKIEDLNVQELIKQYRPEAEFRVKSFLICDAIARQEKLSVMPEEIDHHIEEIAKGANQPVEKVRAYYQKDDLMGVLTTRILHEKSLEFVKNKAKIKLVKPKTKKKA